MWFSLVLLISFLNTQAYALESNDVMMVHILKSYDQNVLALNRGLEDGIVVGDHMKLVNQAGYISRGICIKSELLFSHWRIYRVVNPELMSLDFRYTLIGLNQSEIPQDIQDKSQMLAEQSYQYDDITKRNFDKAVILQQKRIVQSDLSVDVKEDRIFEEASKTNVNRFVERNFSEEQLQEDFNAYQVTLRASPITVQRLNNQREVNYGFNISNFGSKYEFNFDFNRLESREVDFEQNEVSSDSTTIMTNFDINRITESLSYFMFASYNQMKIGQLFNPRRSYEGGILGIKKHLYDGGDIISKFDVSYITTINYIEFDEQDFENATFGDDGDSTIPVKTMIDRRIRHSFRLRLNANLSERVSFNTILWWKPRYLADENKVDYEDTMTDWNSDLIWQLTESVNLSLNYLYTFDINISRQFPDQDPMNQIVSLNVEYMFQL